jgi:hypothetical protein
MTLRFWLGSFLLAVWLAAWLAFETIGVVHLLLLAAAILIVWGLVKRRRTAT